MWNMPRLISKYYHLPDEVETMIIAESDHKFPRETGGLLIGVIQGDYVEVKFATGPGPHALHLFDSFQRDGAYSQQCLDELVAYSSGTYDYIGEWHSHPVDTSPSSKDLAAMRWIAHNPKYVVSRPILGLCVQQRNKSWIVRLYQLADELLQELTPIVFHLAKSNV
jgi:integrative and conjugative element protein (TIGR02256 family)